MMCSLADRCPFTYADRVPFEPICSYCSIAENTYLVSRYLFVTAIVSFILTTMVAYG